MELCLHVSLCLNGLQSDNFTFILENKFKFFVSFVTGGILFNFLLFTTSRHLLNCCGEALFESKTVVAVI